MSLFGDRGTWEFHRISCHLLVDKALPGEPALRRPQDQTPCLHLSKHRGEKPQRKGQIWKTQQWPQDWKRSVFIPIPKKGNAKESSNY